MKYPAITTIIVGRLSPTIQRLTAAARRRQVAAAVAETMHPLLPIYIGIDPPLPRLLHSYICVPTTICLPTVDLLRTAVTNNF